MSNGVLPLSKETLQLLNLKHPAAQEAHHDTRYYKVQSNWFTILCMKTSMNH